MHETPLHFRTITEIAEQIASKQLSPVDVTSAILERIEELDGQLKSYATVIAEQAMAAAQVAEREINAGTYRGPTPWCSYCCEGPLFHKGCPHDGWRGSARRACACV